MYRSFENCEVSTDVALIFLSRRDQIKLVNKMIETFNNLSIYLISNRLNLNVLKTKSMYIGMKLIEPVIGLPISNV